MDILVYMGILIGIVGIITLGIYLIKKFNVKTQELDFAILVIDLVNYITCKFEFKYKEGAGVIMRYTVEALKLVLKYDTLDNKDYETKIDLIFDKAKTVCEDNGISVDNELETILYNTVIYIVKNYI